MSRPGPRPRPPGWRTVNATLGGIAAGLGAVVLARATLGPDPTRRAALVGLAAAAGVALSLFLTAPGRRRVVRGRGRVRPRQWFTPVLASVVAVLAWAAVAHSSGSGWVQAVGVLMAAVLAVGLVAPALPARRAWVRCTACPADGQAGHSSTIVLSASGPIRITPRRPSGPSARAAGAARGTRPVEVTLTPRRRGVHETVLVEVASCAPFGLLWWAREVEVALPRPFHVAPRIGPPGPVTADPDPSPGEARARVPAGTGEPRGIRSYQPGDARGSVHWPATAHVGALMIREKERPTDDPVVVDVVLPADPAEAERRAERAMAVVGAHLGRGRRVLLGTTEPDGHHVDEVLDRIDLGRRLARAVPPAPAVAAVDGRPPR